MKLTKVILVIFISIALFSCTDDQCNLDTESLLSLEINVVDTNLTNIDYTAGLSAFAPEWADSVHYVNQDAKSLDFMLSPNSDTTMIIFTSSDTILKDTLYVYHKNKVRLLSPECGFVFDFTVDSFSNTKNLIDSAFLVKDEITNDENGQIQIYF